MPIPSARFRNPYRRVQRRFAMSLIGRNPLLPFSLINELQRDMNRLFDARLLPVGSGNGSSISNSDWLPPVDIHEDQDSYFLSVDLPGIPSDRIEVTAHGGVLSIRGSRESVYQDKEQKRSERVFGVFLREFSMPDNADLEQVEAKNKDGVLEIRVPKVAKAEPKRISVQ
jgi:HSP20 family protein